MTFADDSWSNTLWAVLHERGHIALPWGGTARTSYPLLPWVGVIALGYASGPWFRGTVAPSDRRRRLILSGAAALTLFMILRITNTYGEPLPWSAGPDAMHSAMSFFNLTKYPPSADFLLLTLGVGAILLAAFERLAEPVRAILVIFGSVPLFFLYPAPLSAPPAQPACVDGLAGRRHGFRQRSGCRLDLAARGLGCGALLVRLPLVHRAQTGQPTMVDAIFVD